MAYKNYISQRAGERAVKRACAELENARSYEDKVVVKWRDNPTNDLAWSELQYAENLRRAAEVKYISTLVAYEKQYGLPYAIGHEIRRILA